MKIPCENCGTITIEGKMAASHSICFYAFDTKGKTSYHRVSSIICNACPNCGHMQNMRLKHPEDILESEDD